MARVKRGVTAHAKHKKVLKAAKGFYGRRKNTIRIAKAGGRQVACSTPTATARTASAISALSGSSASTPPSHEHGLTYGRFIDGLNKAGIEVDRKVLSDMAIHEPAAFGALVAKAKKALEYLKDADAERV